MGLAGALVVAVGLKGGRKAHGLILEATVTGPKGCLQIIASRVLPRWYASIRSNVIKHNV